MKVFGGSVQFKHQSFQTSAEILRALLSDHSAANPNSRLRSGALLSSHDSVLTSSSSLHASTRRFGPPEPPHRSASHSSSLHSGPILFRQHIRAGPNRLEER